MHSWNKKGVQFIPSSFNHPEKTKTPRHKYFTRANHQKIMVDMEQENITYKETLE